MFAASNPLLYLVFLVIVWSLQKLEVFGSRTNSPSKDHLRARQSSVLPQASNDSELLAETEIAKFM